MGPGTNRLAELEPGEAMWLTGPLGSGFTPADAPILCGGGIGAAPLLTWQDEIGPKPPVLLGFRSAEYAEAARLFAGDPRVATDNGSAGHHGLVTELLNEELDPHCALRTPHPPSTRAGPRQCSRRYGPYARSAR